METFKMWKCGGTELIVIVISNKILPMCKNDNCVKWVTVIQNLSEKTYPW
jgi:hypothetical protein